MTVPQRWFRDDAVRLQLGEVGATMEMLDDQTSPLFVGLTLFRFDAGLKRAIVEALTRSQARQRFSPSNDWLLSLLHDIERDPQRFPFSLSEREFAFYARTNFGDKMPALEGVYQPPGFYKALAEDLISMTALSFVGVFLPLIVPGAATASATSAPALATAGGRAVFSGALYGGIAHLMPGGSWDAADKNILWPRYRSDYYRRLLR